MSISSPARDAATAAWIVAYCCPAPTVRIRCAAAVVVDDEMLVLVPDVTAAAAVAASLLPLPVAEVGVAVVVLMDSLRFACAGSPLRCDPIFWMERVLLRSCY